MSRSIAPSYDRHPLWIAWGVLIAGVVLACGKPSADPKLAEKTPAPDTARVVPAGGLASAPTGPVTAAAAGPAPVESGPVKYEDAEKTFKSGDYAGAKDAFERYVAAKPSNPWGHYMLGLSAWKSGDLKRAETAFDRALALDSTQVKSWLGSARVLLDEKREHEALERVEKALALDSTSSDGLRLLARAKSALGETDAAIEVYRKALVLDDKDSWAMNNLGVLYLDQGKPELALGPLARAVELKPTAPVFRNNLGMALERTGHFTAAKEAYEAAVGSDPTYGRAGANRDRLAAMVIDSTDTAGGFVKQQAELFRLLIQMWKDNVR